MSKKIQTYQDLLEEKERLQALLKLQKETLRGDVEIIKQELAPFRNGVSFVSRLLTHKDSSFLVDAGISSLINVGIKNFLLARAGWITRIVVPFFLKNYSSHLFADNKKAIMKKLFAWISKKNANGRAKHHEHQQEDES